jgi:hypothetical protein
MALLCTAIPAGAADLGVYRGEGRPDRVREWGAELGRQPERAIDFLHNTDFRPPFPAVRAWARSPYKLTLSVPILDGRTRYKRVAKVAPAGTIIRLGWEFNGSWFPWGLGDPTAFIKRWKQIRSAMLEVNPTLLFEWTPIAGGGNPEPYWPGNGQVDIVGLDIYPAGRGWPRLARAPFGIRWHRSFARAHAKPISFPEWALWNEDRPKFIRKMARWIRKTSPLYHAYFAFDNGPTMHRLTHFPLARAEFVARFGATGG